MAIPRVTHWSTMATALSPGRSTVSSQCLCKYDTALAFRAFKHSFKTRRGLKKRRQKGDGPHVCYEDSYSRKSIASVNGGSLVEMVPFGYPFTICLAVLA